ncbi:hypothetical protein PYCC9005_002515 [Savitreella phatthalungensis]
MSFFNKNTTTFSASASAPAPKPFSLFSKRSWERELAREFAVAEVKQTISNASCGAIRFATCAEKKAKKEAKALKKADKKLHKDLKARNMYMIPGTAKSLGAPEHYAGLKNVQLCNSEQTPVEEEANVTAASSFFNTSAFNNTIASPVKRIRVADVLPLSELTVAYNGSLFSLREESEWGASRSNILDDLEVELGTDNVGTASPTTAGQPSPLFETAATTPIEEPLQEQDEESLKAETSFAAELNSKLLEQSLSVLSIAEEAQEEEIVDDDASVYGDIPEVADEATQEVIDPIVYANDEQFELYTAANGPLNRDLALQRLQHKAAAGSEIAKLRLHLREAGSDSFVDADDEDNEFREPLFGYCCTPSRNSRRPISDFIRNKGRRTDMIDAAARTNLLTLGGQPKPKYQVFSYDSFNGKMTDVVFDWGSASAENQIVHKA